tara:strand:- start:5455 stop:6786 length:1332 start_codon:yes stop_codon:yes gene_type:complete
MNLNESGEYSNSTVIENHQESSVNLKTLNFGQLLGFNPKTKEYDNAEIPLSIPDYQRIYCWEEKNVYRLLEDIEKYVDKKTYHLGSIILHKTSNTENNIVYDIVDGQQRLVTLSLLLLQLKQDKIGLLNERFESQKAQNYISYNKWLIDNHLQKQTSKSFTLEKILNNLSFSVLVLHSDNLDLAYTFFSNENGKGKSLSDYDLLKSHHLRFIHISEQAKHVAQRWHKLTLSSNNADTSEKLGRTFEIYLFRLRKWMRKRNWDDYANRKVKIEFEAAPIISDIPPFGEQFNFYETIQGGTHFFAYAEHFIHHYIDFRELPVIKLLSTHLNWEKHWWYRDAIEALIFAYYLKFGRLYIERAADLIIQVVSDHRYKNSRAYLHSVLNYVGDSEIVLMIHQATSPTFFLAEMEEKLKTFPVMNSLTGTRERYKKAVDKIKEGLFHKE